MKGLLASPAGFLIGLSMGALGGGGSLIAIPLLVFGADQTAREAQATALVIVSLAALAGIVAYLRAGEVRWRAGTTFGLAAGVAALAGSIVNRELDGNLLLLLFSPVMLAGAAAMVSERARRPADFTPWKFGVDVHEVVRVIGLGLIVGWMIGFFGVGGGFLIVPALVLILHLGMREAVGTSLLVIVIGSQFALAERIGSGDVDWAIAVPFGLAALLGVLAGRRLAHRVEGESLRRAFAGLIVLAALYTAARSIIAL